MSLLIRLAKENFKFSCSHFTILSPTTAERLHGHNYYVSVELRVRELDPTLGMAFDFNIVKGMIRNLVQEWDEKVLIPTASPFLSVGSSAKSVRVRFGDRDYEFPKNEVALLPAVNATAEEFARLLAEGLRARLRSDAPEVKRRISSLSMQVEETRGQSVTYECTMELPA